MVDLPCSFIQVWSLVCPRVSPEIVIQAVYCSAHILVIFGDSVIRKPADCSFNTLQTVSTCTSFVGRFDIVARNGPISLVWFFKNIANYCDYMFLLDSTLGLWAIGMVFILRHVETFWDIWEWRNMISPQNKWMDVCFFFFYFCDHHEFQVSSWSMQVPSHSFQELCHHRHETLTFIEYVSVSS